MSGADKPIFACVLKSGGIYDWSWVHRLRLAVARYHPDLQFVCLTDMKGSQYGIDVVPLVHGWGSWWSKLELFRPGAFPEGQRVVYMDLDVVLFGPIDELLAYEGEFAAFRGFKLKRSLNSSVMAFRAGSPLVNDIWSPFAVRYKTIMRRLRREGDQEWINTMAGAHADRLQDVLPDGFVRSFKLECPAGTDRPPEGLRILVLHGHPKMPDLPAEHWARQQWEGRWAA